MVSSLNITYLIVGAFLIITLTMRLYAGRNIKDMRDYVVGGKSFSTFSLVLTYLATIIGAGTVIGTPEDTFNEGIIDPIIMLSLLIQLLILGYILGPRIIKFKNALTIGDILKTAYGVHAKVLYGIISSLYSLLVTGMQLIVIGKLLQYSFGINQNIGIISSGLLLAPTAYPSFLGFL